MVYRRKMIGGDFEAGAFSIGDKASLLTLTRGVRGTWTTSGRSALQALLRMLEGKGVSHVHLPSYLCESLLQPVQALGLEYSFYPVGRDFSSQPDPPPGSAVLVIDYFGWVSPVVAQVGALAAAGKYWLIEDASQALFSNWGGNSGPGHYTLLSPRKFAPLPLGGWCSAEVPVGRATESLRQLVQRSMDARLAKGVYLKDHEAKINSSIEDSYMAAFRDVEAFLDADISVTEAPQAVLEVAAGLDWEDIAGRRRENWSVLDEMLEGKIEKPLGVLPEGVVPLGYIIIVNDRDRIRKALAGERIFCPVHWPLPSEVNLRDFPNAHYMSSRALTLPVDQRYGLDDMAYISDLIKRLV
jgi:hypothetical protein